MLIIRETQAHNSAQATKDSIKELENRQKNEKMDDFTAWQVRETLEFLKRLDAYYTLEDEMAAKKTR
ncbi:MAG TPA: hypothetical protein VM577_10985 [Anaerovoracaceae bacterium]|nr:hypothetical protein [Anaerovoracaceae bacterium]